MTWAAYLSSTIQEKSFTQSVSNLLIIAVVLLVISILFFSKPFLFPTPKTALTENGIQTLRNDEEVFSMTWNEIAFVRQSSLDGSLIFSNESNSKKMTVYLPIKSWSEIFEKLHGNKKLPEFPVVFKSSKWLPSLAITGLSGPWNKIKISPSSQR